MAHVDINVRILANRCKLQPSGVFRHFGYFRRYRPMAHWKVVLITVSIFCNILVARPRTLLPPYNYSLLLRLCNCSICAQDSTIPWFCWPFVIGHGTPSTQLDGHVVFDFSDREWLHWKPHVVDAVVNNASCAGRIQTQFLLVWQIAPWPSEFFDGALDVFQPALLKHAMLTFGLYFLAYLVSPLPAA